MSESQRCRLNRTEDVSAGGRRAGHGPGAGQAERRGLHLVGPLRDEPVGYSPLDPGFALRLVECQGFRVIGQYGRLGDVKQVVTAPDGRQFLLVQLGFFRRLGFRGRAEIEIPVESVDWIIPVGRRILVT
jgi:hypothetical protein